MPASRSSSASTKSPSPPASPLPPPTHILGVDPGLKGAVALLDLRTRSVHIYDMPITDGRVSPGRLAAAISLMATLADLHPSQIHAAVENVGGRPRQAGVFNFGVSTGIVLGVLGALGIPVTMVAASEWKPAMGLRRLLNETEAQNKSRSRELAQKLFPCTIPIDAFSRVKDDGRAEAALIARFYAAKMGWLK